MTTTAKRLDLPQPRVRDAIVDRFVAGEPIYLLLWDFHLLPSQLEECLREALGGKRKRGKRG